MQVILVGLVAFEVFRDEDSEIWDNFVAYPPGTSLVVTRFLCSTILHMILQGELEQGMQLMKYALNHPYKFSSVFVPFLAGFLQSSVIFLVEVINLINIQACPNNVEAIMNFIALAVISEFDDFLY